jgi:hypothetical protein
MGKEGTVHAAMKDAEKVSGGPAAAHISVLRYLYRSALARYPTDSEVKHLMSDKTRHLPRVSPGVQNTPAGWEAYYQDVFWALLNCNEFFLNH